MAEIESVVEYGYAARTFRSRPNTRRIDVCVLLEGDARRRHRLTVVLEVPLLWEPRVVRDEAGHWGGAIVDRERTCVLAADQPRRHRPGHRTREVQPVPFRAARGRRPTRKLPDSEMRRRQRLRVPLRPCHEPRRGKPPMMTYRT